MKKLLLSLSVAFLLLPAAHAKTDVKDVLLKLADAGLQTVQEGERTEQSVFSVLDGQLQDIKESYKEEGRLYAKEIGDIMLERAMANKKVESTVDSVRALCWSVVAYITAISLLIFGMLLRINSLLKTIRREARQAGESAR